MAWFIFAPVAAIIGAGMYEDRRKEEIRRFNIGVQERQAEREAHYAHLNALACSELNTYLAECAKKNPEMCSEAFARYKAAKCN